MNSLKPNQVTLLSLADYKSRTAPKQSAATGVKPSTPARVEVPTISSGKDGKQKELLEAAIRDFERERAKAEENFFKKLRQIYGVN
jgi:hypothetical protein